MMTYNTTEIKAFLQSHKNLEDAINNIQNITSTKTRITEKGKILFYVPTEVKTKGQVKALIVKYMLVKGFEMTGYESDIPLEGLLEMLEWKIE